MEKNQLEFTELTEETAAFTEQTTDAPELLMKYFDPSVKNWGSHTIAVNLGDITVAINALVDYADLLVQALDKWDDLDAVRRFRFEYHAGRCRKISQDWSEKIGYDRDKALEKCRKRSDREEDVGEDGMTALIKHGAHKKTANDTTITPDSLKSRPPRNKQEQLERDHYLEQKWKELEDIPFDESDTPSGLILAQDWWGFQKGTDREEIWHVFDNLYSKGVAFLLYGTDSTVKN